MGVFSKLFGSEKVIDGAIKGIDSAFYTEEEKADSYERRMGLKAALLQAYQPFKVAQRFLALLYGVPYVVAWSATWAASFFVNVQAQYDMLIESDIAMANLIILAFYFAGGAGESIFKWKARK